MNILIVSGPGISLKQPFNSGIESFIVTLAERLSREGHTVDVVAQEADSEVRFNTLNPFTKSRHIQNKWLKRQVETSEFNRIAIRNYDVVHFNMFYPHLLSARAARTIPSVVTLHSPLDSKRQKVYKKYAKYSGATFIAISDHIKTQWDAGLGIKTVKINNGIDLRTWPVKTTPPNDYLLWSARINEDKNPLAAIEVAEALNMPLKLSGRITDQAYFDTHIRPRLTERIEYIGHVTQAELSDLAQRAAAYLATATWREPFGLTALEMLASGVPVVGFSSAVPADWIHKSVSTAHTHNWEDLVTLVKQQSSSPKECRSFAATMSLEKMTRNYIDLYNRVANRRVELPSLLHSYEFPYSDQPSQVLAHPQTSK